MRKDHLWRKSNAKTNKKKDHPAFKIDFRKRTSGQTDIKMNPHPKSHLSSGEWTLISRLTNVFSVRLPSDDNATIIQYSSASEASDGEHRRHHEADETTPAPEQRRWLLWMMRWVLYEENFSLLLRVRMVLRTRNKRNVVMTHAHREAHVALQISRWLSSAFPWQQVVTDELGLLVWASSAVRLR